MKSTHLEANWPPRQQARPIQPPSFTLAEIRAGTIFVAAVLIALFLMEGVVPRLAEWVVGL